MSGLSLLMVGVATIVALAAREPIRDLFAGLVLRSRCQVGDWLTVDRRLRGTVTHIGLRATRILTPDGIEVSTPHSALGKVGFVEEHRVRRRERVRVRFAVAHGVEPEKVRRRVIASARATPGVLGSFRTSPEVRLLRLGETCLEFELLVWIAEPGARDHVVEELSARIYSTLLGAVVEVGGE